MVFPNFPAIILLAPLLAALLIGLLARPLGAKVSRIGVAAEVAAFALSLAVLYEVTNNGPQVIHFLPARDGLLQFSLHIDRLAAVMLVHIAAITTLIHFFSLSYMRQEPGHVRYYSLLAFTTFILFAMVTSANLLLLFFCWQALSWLLPLLSTNNDHVPTQQGTFRTFIMQRAGDVAFLAGALLAYGFYGTFDLQQLFSRAAGAQYSVEIWPGGLAIHANTAITLLIFIGAMSKSAQFPFHIWLPDYLYAPTPVTALLHAGIINAGGFLLARLAPLYALSPTTLHWTFAVGMLTALLGSSMMLVQNDIKKTLGYSTIGQMGFMIMECGLGAYGLAIFHLIAHGLFKGTIFLNSGYLIHAARQEPRQPNQDQPVSSFEFSTLTWLTGFSTTLILPLVIVLAAHGILNIPLADSQGAAIFLFFGWATSAQAMLTLYRLRAVASWKVAVVMLTALFVVILTYLMAAESFTHFLYPGAGEVANHFRAGALPGIVFDLLVIAFALVIILGWILIYAASHGRTIQVPAWATTLQVRLYLLLINRLYLDTLSIWLRPHGAHLIASLDGSKMFPYLAALLAIGAGLLTIERWPELSMVQALQLLIAAFLLPLFPLHGVYGTALTRSPAAFATLLTIALPVIGAFGLADVAKDLPNEIRQFINLLAIAGVVYGSVKALAQVRIPELLAYASLAFFSVFWWHVTATGRFTVAAFVYVITVALLTAGMLRAWQLLRKRYGDLTIDRMHGLARPMPRFATMFALCVIAALSLPPITLIASHKEFAPMTAPAFPLALGVVLLSWFFASWYLFRMMQKLLFGTKHATIAYQDLRTGDIAFFVILLAILAMLSATPPVWLESEIFNNRQRSAMESRL